MRYEKLSVPGACWSRRQWLRTGLGYMLLGRAGWCRAAGQVEEPLADSVRSALSAAVHDPSPPVPVFTSTQDRMAYLRWLVAMSDRLRSRMPDLQVRKEFLQTAWYEARRAGLDVALVLGVIQVESSFRRYAVSAAGAIGYMQVMPFWVRLIGDGDVSVLFQPQVNLRFGCVILRHYLDMERGNLFMALGRYNGSRGKDAYPDMVLRARRLWEFADPGTAAG